VSVVVGSTVQILTLLTITKQVLTLRLTKLVQDETHQLVNGADDFRCYNKNMKTDFLVSMLFLLLTVLSFFAAVVFFEYGIPLAGLFFSGFLWFMANKLAKRRLTFKENWLSLLPIIVAALFLIIGQSPWWDFIFNAVFVLGIYHLFRAKKLSRAAKNYNGGSNVVQ